LAGLAGAYGEGRGVCAGANGSLSRLRASTHLQGGLNGRLGGELGIETGIGVGGLGEKHRIRIERRHTSALATGPALLLLLLPRLTLLLLLPGLTTATTSVLGSSRNAAGLLDSAELIVRLGLDHRGLVEEHLITSILDGGEAATLVQDLLAATTLVQDLLAAATLCKHGVLEGECGALTTSLLLALPVSATGLLVSLAVGLVTVTAGHLLP
jgi:hypothetical protein